MSAVCLGCIEDNVPKPWVITPEIRLVAALIRKLYLYAPTGGACHVATDDYNLEDVFVEGSRDYLHLSNSPKERDAAEAVIRGLTYLSLEDRYLACGVAHGDIE